MQMSLERTERERGYYIRPDGETSFDFWRAPFSKQDKTKKSPRKVVERERERLVRSASPRYLGHARRRAPCVAATAFVLRKQKNEDMMGVNWLEEEEDV